MTISRFMAFLACGAMLALGACSNSRTVATDALDDDAHEEEHRRAADELARATAALGVLRASLANAQAALEAVGGSGANARADAVKALTKVEADLEVLQSGLTALPASPARTAVTAAVTAVDNAVAAVKAALAPMSAAGGGGYFLRQYAHEAGPGAGGAG